MDYFDGRADADQPAGAASPIPNEEMKLYMELNALNTQLPDQELLQDAIDWIIDVEKGVESEVGSAIIRKPELSLIKRLVNSFSTLQQQPVANGSSSTVDLSGTMTATLGKYGTLVLEIFNCSSPNHMELTRFETNGLRELLHHPNTGADAELEEAKKQGLVVWLSGLRDYLCPDHEEEPNKRNKYPRAGTKLTEIISALQQREVTESCIWTQHPETPEIEAHTKTACGANPLFNYGRTPRHCHGCGKRISVQEQP